MKLSNFKLTIIFVLALIIIRCDLSSDTSNANSKLENSTQNSETPDFASILKEFKKEVEKKDTFSIFKRIGNLSRNYPLPSITNYEEFKLAYDEIFDSNLTQKILNSKLEDWEIKGWRGQTLDGIIWFDDGGPNIYKIDYVSEKGIAKRKAIIEADRAYLHSSLRKFEAPVLEWILKPEHLRDDYDFLPEYNLRIRIDYLGDDNYRLAIWRWGKDINYLYHKNPEKEWSYNYIVGDMIFDTYFPPEIVLENGKFEREGQLGDYSISYESPMGTVELQTLLSSPEIDAPGLLISNIPIIIGKHYAIEEVNPLDKEKNYEQLKKLRKDCCPNGEIPIIESYTYNWNNDKISFEMIRYADKSPYHEAKAPINHNEEEYVEEEEQTYNLYESKLAHLKNVKRYSVDESHPSACVIMKNGDSIFVSVESEACDIYHTFHTKYINRNKINHKKELLSFAKDMLGGYDSFNKVKDYINAQKTIETGFSGSIKINEYLSYLIEISDEEDGSCRIHIREQ